MPGPRDYGTGTEKALFVLSQGNCYYPDCCEPAIKFVEGHPATNLQIAHIRGANLGSARHEPHMTDAERAHFSNLVLMCKPHHDLIDKIRPVDYPAPLLKSWKADREGDYAGDLLTLGGIPEERLFELMKEAVRESMPQRDIAVELQGALMLGDHGIMLVPLAAFREIYYGNPHLPIQSLAVALTARNIGSSPVTIEEVSLEVYTAAESGIPGPVSLRGLNGYPYNAALPHRMKIGGEAIRYFWSTETIEAAVNGQTYIPWESLGATARLASGEKFFTERFPVDFACFRRTSDRSSYE